MLMAPIDKLRGNWPAYTEPRRNYDFVAGAKEASFELLDQVDGVVQRCKVQPDWKAIAEEVGVPSKHLTMYVKQHLPINEYSVAHAAYERHVQKQKNDKTTAKRQASRRKVCVN